jgi:hypothetical protein
MAQLNLTPYQLDALIVRGRGLYAYMLAGIARVDSCNKTPPNLSANNYALELDFDGMPAVDSNVLRAIQDASQP